MNDDYTSLTDTTFPSCCKLFIEKLLLYRDWYSYLKVDMSLKWGGVSNNAQLHTFNMGIVSSSMAVSNVPALLRMTYNTARTIS